MKLRVDGERYGVLGSGGGNLRKLRSRMEREAKMGQGSGAVRTRARRAVRMAVGATFSVSGAGLRVLELVHVPERKRERIQRIARTRLPCLRYCLAFVLVLLAVMLLRMEQRCDHQAENCDRGEDQPPI